MAGIAYKVMDVSACWLPCSFPVFLPQLKGVGVLALTALVFTEKDLYKVLDSVQSKLLFLLVSREATPLFIFFFLFLPLQCLNLHWGLIWFGLGLTYNLMHWRQTPYH